MLVSLLFNIKMDSFIDISSQEFSRMLPYSTYRPVSLSVLFHLLLAIHSLVILWALDPISRSNTTLRLTQS